MVSNEDPNIQSLVDAATAAATAAAAAAAAAAAIYSSTPNFLIPFTVRGAQTFNHLQHLHDLRFQPQRYLQHQNR